MIFNSSSREVSAPTGLVAAHAVVVLKAVTFADKNAWSLPKKLSVSASAGAAEDLGKPRV